jgi:predicted transcriptional regulator
MKELSNKRGLKYKEKIEVCLKQGDMMKDIADKLKISRNLVSKYIKIFDLNYDGTKKQKLELERLEHHRKLNSEKVKSRSKTYTIASPNGEITVTRKIFKFCRDNNLDYKNLRNTYNNIKKDKTNSKHKNFYILKEEFN